MAIKKEIVKDSGLKVAYHRIKSIAINERNNKCAVTIEEYVNDSFRKEAKDAIETSNKVQELYERAQIEENEQLANALIEKANIMAASNEEKLNNQYFVKERVITFDNIPKDCTVAGFYKELMKLEEFKDSEEV